MAEVTPGHFSYSMRSSSIAFPLFDPSWGIYTLPYFIRRIYADVFTDVGDAFDGEWKLSRLLVGSGAELFTNFELTYRVTVTLRIGVARGWCDGGTTQVYAHLARRSDLERPWRRPHTAR